jgi:hypothetical protein
MEQLFESIGHSVTRVTTGLPICLLGRQRRASCRDAGRIRPRHSSGETLAISIPIIEGRWWHFEETMPYGLFVPDVCDGNTAK